VNVPAPIILAAWDAAVLALIAAALLLRRRADRKEREAADWAAWEAELDADKRMP
jgi:hypothetical protein